jgi:hypothetical protein
MSDASGPGVLSDLSFFAAYISYMASDLSTTGNNHSKHSGMFRIGADVERIVGIRCHAETKVGSSHRLISPLIGMWEFPLDAGCLNLNRVSQLAQKPQFHIPGKSLI